jgi:Flp pilus assembly protein TadD
MPIISAENEFKKGLVAVVDQDYVEAAMHFRRAMDIEHQRRVLHPDMRYLSYYGLCRAKAHGQVRQGLHECRRAAMLRDRDPEMFLNLGRVQLLAGNPRAALTAFRSGLLLDPMHEALVQEAERVERRVQSIRRNRTGLLALARAAWSRPSSASR